MKILVVCVFCIIGASFAAISTPKSMVNLLKWFIYNNKNIGTSVALRRGGGALKTRDATPKKPKRGIPMLRKITGTFITVAAITLLVGSPGVAFGQTAGEQPQGHMHGEMKGGNTNEDDKTASCCQQMGEKKKAMHAEQMEAQVELDQLVEVVNSSTGDAQQAAIAALLTKLVEQRSQMSGMMQMHPEMMKGMMSGGMSDCPMMQKADATKGAEELSADDDDHSQHH